jgi:hypothetical protein
MQQTSHKLICLGQEPQKWSAKCLRYFVSTVFITLSLAAIAKPSQAQDPILCSAACPHSLLTACYTSCSVNCDQTNIEWDKCRECCQNKYKECIRKGGASGVKFTDCPKLCTAAGAG